MKALLSAAVLVAQLVAASTQVVKFDPAAMATMTVQFRLTGHCTVSQYAPGRSDAYRCAASGGVVFDPCFASKWNEAGCPIYGSHPGRAIVTLDKPLPAHPKGSGQRQAWAMILTSGANCMMPTQIHVKKFPFACFETPTPKVCAMPDLSKPQPAYFVRCGEIAPGGVVNIGSTLAKIVYW